MNRDLTTVLVAVEPQWMREVLCASLARDGRIAVASQAADPLEVLASAARVEAGVVIVTSSESAGIPSLATHLFAEFPEITVIGICRQTGEVRAHRQVVTSRTISAESIDQLVAAICNERAIAQPPSLIGAGPQAIPIGDYENNGRSVGLRRRFEL
jgi:hypothetical protein